MNGVTRTGSQPEPRTDGVVVKDPNPILKYFAYQHLPEALQKVSKPFGELALLLDIDLTNGAEKSVGLRKLLESKDAAVRAGLG